MIKPIGIEVARKNVEFYLEQVNQKEKELSFSKECLKKARIWLDEENKKR